MKQKFAICNEVFGSTQDMAAWREVCAAAAGMGYDGIEIAPFTFASSVEEIHRQQRRDIRQIAADNSLEIVGLHWLLASPPGLHIHSTDEKLRRRTTDYLHRLIELAGDLNARALTFGSPAQRRLENGDYLGAWQRTQQSYRDVLPALEAQDVFLCQESLPAPECDFIQTAAEAQRMVEEINHPHFQLMLDAKSMSAEMEEPAEIIRKFGRGIRHFHANDANRRGPGFGDTDFHPICSALGEVEYSDYVSVEPFDYSPDPHTVARESLRYLHEVWRQE